MKIREMVTADIDAVLPMYISYYNRQENGCWTKETAGRRIHQVVSMEGAYEHQNKGIGSMLIDELEKRVKSKGAACVELQAVSDEHHEKYYGKAGYGNAKNFVMKVKWL